MGQEPIIDSAQKVRGDKKKSTRPEVYEAVEAILDECGDMPSRTIARLLVERRPDLWGTGERAIHNARMAVLQHRGRRKHKSLLKACPNSLAQEWVPYKLDGVRRVLVLSDIHLPYHDRRALETAVAHSRAFKPDCILLNGDTLDYHSCSDYCKDPRMWSTARETDYFDDFFDWIHSVFPRARVIFKEGNHEERIKRYLWDRAPAMAELDGVTLPGILRADQRGIIVVADRRPIVRGRLHILHGHEYGGWLSSPVNPARGAYLRSHECVIIGHHHQPSSHSETTLAGRLITTWSLGCLCYLHPQYRPINKWAHGWAWVEFGDKDEFSVRPFKLVSGNVFPA